MRDSVEESTHNCENSNSVCVILPISYTTECLRATKKIFILFIQGYLIYVETTVDNKTRHISCNMIFHTKIQENINLDTY